MAKRKTPRPCAFCGCKQVYPGVDHITEGKEDSGLALYAFYCNACTSRGPQAPTEKEALVQWNKRPYIDKVASKKTLEKLLDKARMHREFQKLEQEIIDHISMPLVQLDRLHRDARFEENRASYWRDKFNKLYRATRFWRTKNQNWFMEDFEPKPEKKWWRK